MIWDLTLKDRNAAATSNSAQRTGRAVSRWKKKCPQEKLHERFLFGLLFLVTLESSNFLSSVLRIFHAKCICALKHEMWRPRYKFELILNLLSSFQVEKAMAPHSSTLAWKIPWMEEPGRLQSMGSLRDGHDWTTSLSLFTFMNWRRKWQPTPVFLTGESQGQGSLVGCHLWGCTESDKTEVT